MHSSVEGKIMAHNREDWVDEYGVCPGSRRGKWEPKSTMPKPYVNPPGQAPCDNFGCEGPTGGMVCPECIEELKLKVKRLEQWISDLQSGMHLNCVYCGHRYGPGVSVEVLHDHIQQCPHHPLTRVQHLLVDAMEQIDMLNQEIVILKEERDYWEQKYRMS
jgi:hypothetical protein